MAIVVLLAGSWIGYRRLSDSGCSGRVTLTVAAATELAPAVDQAAQQWVADGANLDKTCVAVTVTGVNPATMAAAVARQHNVTLSGAPTVPKSVQRRTCGSPTRPPGCSASSPRRPASCLRT